MIPAPAFASATIPARSFTGLGTVLQHLRSYWRDAKAQRQEVARITRELQTCTDRQLGDLGLSRADIPAVAYGTFRAG